MFGNLSISSSLSMSRVSGSTEIISTSTSDLSGTYSIRRSRSSSCNFNEIPRTGPRWIRFIRCVVKPAILFRNLLVDLEIECELCVIFFHDHTRGLLHCLCPYTPHAVMNFLPEPSLANRKQHKAAEFETKLQL